ncbi:MAG: restriction endonuclease [Anaerolineae bacterium]|nr:restriction endonuclease [Anaerolineae bacterium]
MERLTLAKLKKAASVFVRDMSRQDIPDLFGVSDGKAVGTYVEHSFHGYLRQRYIYDAGSSASGIDFPELEIDLKVTSARQPQSSCPYRDAGQKVYGVGYHLLVFVYNKQDDNVSQIARLQFQSARFIHKTHTADYQTTRGILEILERDGNVDDIVAFLEERNLPLDEMGRLHLAECILKTPPRQGYLTISNALQWRLQYGRAVKIADEGGGEGIENLL